MQLPDKQTYARRPHSQIMDHLSTRTYNHVSMHSVLPPSHFQDSHHFHLTTPLPLIQIPRNNYTEPHNNATPTPTILSQNRPPPQHPTIHPQNPLPAPPRIRDKLGSPDPLAPKIHKSPYMAHQHHLHLLLTPRQEMGANPANRREKALRMGESGDCRGWRESGFCFR